MTIDRDTIVVRSKEPVETTVGTEIVLMTLESGKCFGLGDTGSDIWRLIERPIQLSLLVDALTQTYDASADLIERDVIALLEQMEGWDLVECRE